MKHYDVIISDKAYNDMEGIYDHINEKLHAPVAAANQYNSIADAILSLEIMPERKRLMDSEPERSKGFRIMPINNYSIIFTVKGNLVNIIRVLYSASDIVTRLREG